MCSVLKQSISLPKAEYQRLGKSGASLDAFNSVFCEFTNITLKPAKFLTEFWYLLVVTVHVKNSDLLNAKCFLIFS